MRTYGEYLREQRLIRGISQTKLGKLTGIAHQNIQRWEKDIVLPNIDFCVILADFYGITLDELVGRNVVNERIYNDIHHNNIVNINQK